MFYPERLLCKMNRSEELRKVAILGPAKARSKRINKSDRQLSLDPKISNSI
jgi:hypothetical protein